MSNTGINNGQSMTYVVWRRQEQRLIGAYHSPPGRGTGRVSLPGSREVPLPREVPHPAPRAASGASGAECLVESRRGEDTVTPCEELIDAGPFPAADLACRPQRAWAMGDGEDSTNEGHFFLSTNSRGSSHSRQDCAKLRRDPVPR